MTPRRLLVATYYYPPQPGSGSNRWAAMVKYLRRQGHSVTVVTAAPPGVLPGTDDGVLRTSSLNSSPLLRRILLRPERSSLARAASATQQAMLPPALWRVLVPDPWLVTWEPYALAAIRCMLSERSFDCLITSSPAQSTHLLGLLAGRRRPPWIADFRDGWCFESIRPRFPLAAQRAVDRQLERLVVTEADVVVGVTAPIAEDLHARFGAHSVHIPNGFDAETPLDDSILDEYQVGPLTLVHTGALVGPSSRDPRPFLLALKRVADEQPELGGQVQLLVAGRSEFDETRLLAEAGLAGVVRHLGHVPRAQALALQRAAGTLILLTSDARGEATGKLYEYLAAGRPIVALARGNEAARIVAETGTGAVVAPDDVDAIAGALRQALSGELAAAYRPHELEPYTYPAPAEQMAKAIELAMVRHDAQPRQPRGRPAAA